MKHSKVHYQKPNLKLPEHFKSLDGFVKTEEKCNKAKLFFSNQILQDKTSAQDGAFLVMGRALKVRAGQSSGFESRAWAGLEPFHECRASGLDGP